MYIMIQCFPNSAEGNQKFYWKGAGFPIGGGGAWRGAPHPMNFFEKNCLPPPIKTNAPPWGAPSLKNEVAPSEKQPPH